MITLWKSSLIYMSTLYFFMFISTLKMNYFDVLCLNGFSLLKELKSFIQEFESRKLAHDVLYMDPSFVWSKLHELYISLCGDTDASPYIKLPSLGILSQLFRWKGKCLIVEAWRTWSNEIKLKSYISCAVLKIKNQNANFSRFEINYIVSCKKHYFCAKMKN